MTDILFGQTTVDTKTVTLKNIKNKKVIKVSKDIYVLCFDAQDYITTLDSNSLTRTKLIKYFDTADTLSLTHEVEKKLNVWLIKEFEIHKNSALAFGNVSIFNGKTKKLETHLISKNTTINQTKEKPVGKQVFVDRKIQVTYELLSHDQKYKFISTTMFSDSQYTK